MLLKVALERTSTVCRFVSLLDSPVGCALGEFDVDVPVLQATTHILDVFLTDANEVGRDERVEQDDVRQTVQELRPHLLADLSHDELTGLLGQLAVLDVVGSAQQHVRADVGGHDEHGVGEVHGTALGVGQAAVVKNLQQHVEHLPVRLLDLIQKHEVVGALAHGLRELPALLVADVAGRGADHPRHGVRLHVLGHIDTDHVLLVVEELER
mmetsp:Transcript_10525/g.20901  ORF Transcript_10525/g.20901 Transcript_10525/m.20901 type:complete len:211 (+) Transcript_10525:482-1114(+)